MGLRGLGGGGGDLFNAKLSARGMGADHDHSR